MRPSDDPLRQQLLTLLESRNAHADFETVVGELPSEARGLRPEQLPYSPWELLEHIRIAQWDILDFCRNPEYEQPNWPEEYWPDGPEPPNEEAWTNSIAAYRRDLEGMKDLVRDPDLDLDAEIPHGDGQTYLREVLLVADHTSYHLGQLVTVRRQLGVWESAR